MVATWNNVRKLGLDKLIKNTICKMYIVRDIKRHNITNSILYMHIVLNIVHLSLLPQDCKNDNGTHQCCACKWQ
jgi:hypothetical protein